MTGTSKRYLDPTGRGDQGLRILFEIHPQKTTREREPEKFTWIRD
jgi:hypothetical protein